MHCFQIISNHLGSSAEVMGTRAMRARAAAHKGIYVCATCSILASRENAVHAARTVVLLTEIRAFFAYDGQDGLLLSRQEIRHFRPRVHASCLLK